MFSLASGGKALKKYIECSFHPKRCTTCCYTHTTWCLCVSVVADGDANDDDDDDDEDDDTMMNEDDDMIITEVRFRNGKDGRKNGNNQGWGGKHPTSFMSFVS